MIYGIRAASVEDAGAALEVHALRTQKLHLAIGECMPTLLSDTVVEQHVKNGKAVRLGDKTLMWVFSKTEKGGRDVVESLYGKIDDAVAARIESIRVDTMPMTTQFGGDSLVALNITPPIDPLDTFRDGVKEVMTLHMRQGDVSGALLLYPGRPVVMLLGEEDDDGVLLVDEIESTPKVMAGYFDEADDVYPAPLPSIKFDFNRSRWRPYRVTRYQADAPWTEGEVAKGKDIFGGEALALVDHESVLPDGAALVVRVASSALIEGIASRSRGGLFLDEGEPLPVGKTTEVDVISLLGIYSDNEMVVAPPERPNKKASPPLNMASSFTGQRYYIDYDDAEATELKAAIRRKGGTVGAKWKVGSKWVAKEKSVMVPQAVPAGDRIIGAILLNTANQL
jgi:hypothetical protein